MSKKNLTVKGALIRLYNHQYKDYTRFVAAEENKDKASLFAKFIEMKFAEFIDIVKLIAPDDLLQFIARLDDFVPNKTRIRFINLLKIICKKYLIILRKCYCSNPVDAIKDLEKLLGAHNHKLTKYINEQLVNYCTYTINNNEILYRVRDEKASNNVDNCWHVPFNIRQYSYSGRFSSPGFPCLYLSNNIETCLSEVRQLKSEYKRWIGEFSINNDRILLTLDLRFPSHNTIAHMNDYDMFCAFLSYPIRLLCGIPALHKSDSFAEEYLFSQLLINLLSNPTNDKFGLTSIRGVTYDSTKHVGGINYAFPAVPKHYPPEGDEKVSERLKILLFHSKPYPLS